MVASLFMGLSRAIPLYETVFNSDELILKVLYVIASQKKRAFT